MVGFPPVCESDWCGDHMIDQGKVGTTIGWPDGTNFYGPSGSILCIPVHEMKWPEGTTFKDGIAF